MDHLCEQELTVGVLIGQERNGNDSFLQINQLIIEIRNYGLQIKNKKIVIIISKI